MSELKTKQTDADVMAFLDSVAPDQRRADARVVHDMMQRIIGCPARMWGSNIVGFGSYHYTYASGREGDWFMTGFSPRKQALTLYVMPGFRDYGALMDRLGKHKTGKSCLYINKLEDIDSGMLEELIRRSVEYMKQKYGA